MSGSDIRITQNGNGINTIGRNVDFVNENSRRARQNVIFELGYCMGKLGRKSGRVIVLLKGDVDIPSDLGGILYINIDNGIAAAGEQIRKAIEAADTASPED